MGQPDRQRGQPLMPDPTTADPFRRPSLADTLADTHHCSFFNTSVLIRAFKDWLTQEGKAPLAMRELLEAQAQIAESDPHA
jgi:hypothetical protein